MLNWFAKNASIKAKFRVILATNSMIAIGGLVNTYLAAITPPQDAMIYIVSGSMFLVLAIVSTLYFGAAISRSYTPMVLRTESLAAGDLDSPISHTDQRDCLGRLARALRVFRDHARETAAAKADQEAIVAALGEKLSALSGGI